MTMKKISILNQDMLYTKLQLRKMFEDERNRRGLSKRAFAKLIGTDYDRALSWFREEKGNISYADSIRILAAQTVPLPDGTDPKDYIKNLARNEVLEVTTNNVGAHEDVDAKLRTIDARLASIDKVLVRFADLLATNINNQIKANSSDLHQDKTDEQKS